MKWGEEEKDGCNYVGVKEDLKSQPRMTTIPFARFLAAMKLQRLKRNDGYDRILVQEVHF